MRRLFELIDEPRGDLLRRLTRAIAARSSFVQVVLRDNLGRSEAAASLLSQLDPYLTERRRGSSWPGTVLLDDEADIVRFWCNDLVTAQLLAVADGLYDWKQPALPEDLTFLREDGTPFLASTSHERDAFLEIDDREYQALLRMVPELSKLARVQVE